MIQKKELREYAAIVLGAFIMGFAIKNIYDPANLVTGGVSGIAIIVKNLLGAPLWLTNTMLNIPLFLAAWRLKGWTFIRRTLAATVSLSISLYIIPEIPLRPDDLLLSALFGGIVSGIGTGLVFMYQATTGGTDMLAALIQLKMRQYSIAWIMQFLDGMVVLAGASIFGIHHALYAIIAIYCVCKLSDNLLDGLKFATQAVIILTGAGNRGSYYETAGAGRHFHRCCGYVLEKWKTNVVLRGIQKGNCSGTGHCKAD